MFQNPILNDSLLGVICSVRDAIFPLVMALAVIAFLFSAYYYLIANGDAGKLGTAKKALWYAIIGVVVALLSFGIPSIIFELFGVSAEMAC